MIISVIGECEVQHRRAAVIISVIGECEVQHKRELPDQYLLSVRSHWIYPKLLTRGCYPLIYISLSVSPEFNNICGLQIWLPRINPSVIGELLMVNFTEHLSWELWCHHLVINGAVWSVQHQEGAQLEAYLAYLSWEWSISTSTTGRCWSPAALRCWLGRSWSTFHKRALVIIRCRARWFCMKYNTFRGSLWSYHCV